MQKPVRPTSWSRQAEVADSSVMLGTRQTIRASAPARACVTPAASTTGRDAIAPLLSRYMLRRYSPPTS